MLNLKLRASALVLCLLMFLLLPFASFGEGDPAKPEKEGTEVQEPDKKQKSDKGQGSDKGQKSDLDKFTLEQLIAFLLAVGAIGAAAMAVSEGFKTCWLTPMGFKPFKKNISWADKALEVAYGPKYEETLESLYRMNRSKGDLPKILRQGVRIGMTTKTAGELSNVVGDCTAEQLEAVAGKVAAGELLAPGGKETPDEKRVREAAKNTLGRFEMAADARIEAALSLAERHYTNGMRLGAFVVAIALSVGAALLIGNHENDLYKYWIHGVIVGLIAVPIAPIAKDLTKGLQSATKAVKAIK